MNYLGVTLSHVKSNVDFNNIINTCRRAYYALQCAVLNNNISDTDALSYVWKAAVRLVLKYCCNSVYVSKKSLNTMERLQTKILKAIVGLHKYSKSKPVLKVLNVNKKRLSK